MTDEIKDHLIRRRYKKKYQYCHDIAARIVHKLKYNNEEAQKYIDLAKDELYRAAIILKQKGRKMTRLEIIAQIIGYHFFKPDSDEEAVQCGKDCAIEIIEKLEEVEEKNYNATWD